MKAIIVGAGIGGLAAGYRLKKRGWEVTVLESDDEIGGRTSTFTKNGYTLERGATQLSTGYKAYLQLAEELGLQSEIVESEQTVLIARNGRLYPLNIAKPLSAAFSGVLGFGSKLKLLNAIWDMSKIRPRINVLDISKSAEQIDRESAKDYALRRLNREIYDVLIDPMIRLYVLNNGENTSALELFSSFSNLAGNRLTAITGGTQRLPDALANHLDVRTASPVAQICKSDAGVEVHLASPSGSKPLKADACIVATRLHQTHDIVPEMRGHTGPLKAAMPYNRAVVVTLGFAADIQRKGQGILLGCKEHPQIGLVWFDHRKVANDAAPAGHALITCYFEESGLDSVQPDTDETFIAIAKALIFTYFPELKGTGDMVSVTRWADAIPNPGVGTYRALHQFHQSLDQTSPIQVTGDYLTCTGQNSAIHWGQVTADRIDKYIGRRNSPPKE